MNWNITQTGYVPDGTDFYLDGNGVRHIRWYGLPRDSDGTGINPTNWLLSNSSPQTGYVLPLAYYLNYATFNSNLATFASFEKLAYSYGSTFNHYICAWDAASGALRPTMFRITIELIDADGRLTSPRVFQYILPVQS
jgi:hypothetical protein